MLSVQSAWARVKSYDSMDWAFLVLSLAIVAVGAAVVARVANEEAEQWTALEFVTPVRIIDGDGYVPQEGALDPPSFPGIVGTEIPARLTRVIDCESFTCPAGLLPIEVDARWTLNINGINQSTQFVVLEGFRASLEEGISYIRGEKGTFTIQLNPYRVPQELVDFADEHGLETSDWRVSGEVTPLVGEDAPPVAFVTEIFHIDHTVTGAD